MSVADLEDPFAAPEDVAAQAMTDNRKKIITAGRYRLPNLDGSHKPGGWQRVTNLVSAYSDQFGLRLWEIEQVMIALSIAPDLVLADLLRTLDACAAMPKKEKREEIEEFLTRCKELAGGNEGTKFGNSRHGLVEADHLALPMGAPDAYARQHLSLYRSALVRNELRALEGMQERRVLIPDLDAVGTLDNVLEDLRSSLLHIGDLKTQKRFWTWLEIAAQLAIYAHAVAMWEPASLTDQRAGRWVDMPKVDQSIAHVLWMPKDHPSGQPMVEVYEVDIVAGWRTAKLAREVVVDRQGGKSKTAPRAWLRAAPDVTLTEIYAAKFATVETVSDGAKLVEECKAKRIWDVLLAGEARAAMDRIKLAQENPFEGLRTH